MNLDVADFIDRDISWLGFNERVLQEAEDERNPLIERFRFLGIYSNNMDEFYRVRVASAQRLVKLYSKGKKKFESDPNLLLTTINKRTKALQVKFERIFRKLIVEAKQQGVHLIDEEQCNKSQREEVNKYFNEVVRTNLVPIILNEKAIIPQLKDKRIYLAIKLYKKKNKDIKYAYLEIPTKVVSRFKVLESKGAKKYIILLDDIIRANLVDLFHIFDFDHIEAYTFKITLDAELDIEEDLYMSTIERINKSLLTRKKNSHTRFVYDRDMPEDFKTLLFKKLKIKEDENVIAGGRYHNFKDFINVPSLKIGKQGFSPLPPIKHPDVTGNDVLSCVRKQDIFLNYPFQSFDVIIDMLREAAIDPKVKSIKINLYRVASNSKIINALVNAANNGKKVTAVVELRARFDEENNIYWANQLKEEGVDVVFGVPSLKVHSKLILISRKEEGKLIHYAHVGTGNFHEGTARIYTDMALLTADQRISSEVAKVFDFFDNNFKVKRYSHLIISPTGTRRKFMDLIHNEIKNAKKGKEAAIFIKLNNLVDEKMVKKLYDASKAGVKIRLIVRGSCSVVPGVKGVSENIEVISIIDRFLEHSRVLWFKNGGDDKIYISSADWLTRNLDKRVEVSTPIYDANIKEMIMELMEIQWKDNSKARYTGLDNLNEYRKTGESNFRSQTQTYKYFRKRLK